MFANSCELGIGGGKNVDEGDGNGDADDGVSTANVTLGWPDSVADGPTAAMTANDDGNGYAKGCRRERTVNERLENEARGTWRQDSLCKIWIASVWDISRKLLSSVALSLPLCGTQIDVGDGQVGEADGGGQRRTS